MVNKATVVVIVILKKKCVANVVKKATLPEYAVLRNKVPMVKV